MHVEVIVTGRDRAAAGAGARRAIRKLGARTAKARGDGRQARSGVAGRDATPVRDIIPRTPLISFFSEWKWPQFAGGARGGPSIPWRYNPAGAPDGASEAIFGHALDAWSRIRRSAFAFSDHGSTARCPSQICDGFVLDGFNDVGWTDLGTLGSNEVTPLALAVVEVDASDAILEADIGMNSQFPLWTTDGTGIDIQTVMVHELGHGAGLGHSAELRSVMQPLYTLGAVFRSPSERDRAAIVHLYPADPRNPSRGPLLAPPPALKASVVATLGDPVKRGGSLSEYLQIGQLNDRGQLALVSFLEVDGEGIGDGVFRARGKRLEEVARAGQLVPGAGTLDSYELGNLGINSRGDIAFAYQLGPTAGLWGEQAGVFLANGRGGPLRALVVPGSRAGSDTLLGATEVKLNDRGQVVFQAPFPTALGPFSDQPGYGVFSVASTGGPVVPIARPGDPFVIFGPGDFTALASALVPMVNARGDVAFEGMDDFAVAGAGCLLGGATPDCDGRVYAYRAASRALDDRLSIGFEPFIVGAGLPEIAWGRAFGPDIDGAGNVLAGNTPTVVNGGPLNGGGLFTYGLYRYGDRGVRRPVIQPGDALPGGGHLWSEGLWHTVKPWAMNDDGDIAFIGMLDTDPVPAAGRVEGVYVKRGRRTRLVARNGTYVPGVGRIARVLGDAEGDPAIGLGFNDRDEVAFGAELTDGRIVVLQTGS